MYISLAHDAADVAHALTAFTHALHEEAGK
jgi:hypothetical protein